jgi:uncharacterized membrane protein affecting hemolysin expression
MLSYIWSTWSSPPVSKAYSEIKDVFPQTNFSVAALKFEDQQVDKSIVICEALMFSSFVLGVMLKKTLFCEFRKTAIVNMKLNITYILTMLISNTY